MKNSYALVTGASSGIGLEISNELAKQGFNVILTARREDKLRNEAEKIQRKYKFKKRINLVLMTLLK